MHAEKTKGQIRKKKEVKKIIKVLFFTVGSDLDKGAFRSLVNLCKVLKKSGEIDPVVVFCRKASGKRVLDELVIRSYFVRSYSWIIDLDEKKAFRFFTQLVKRFLNLFAIQRIIKIAEKENVDIIDINTIGTYVGAKIALKTGTPFVWHIREIIKDHYGQELAFKSDSKLINRADAIITISDSVKKAYMQVLDEEKMHTVYNGVAISDYLYPEHKLFRSDIVKFTCVGRISEGKGQRKIIEATSILIDRGYNNFYVSFYGDGEKKEEYERDVRERGLSGYLKFEGVTYDIRKMYDSFDVLLMCSEGEAFGRVTVEAMLKGCLVLGMDSGGTREIIEDERTGLLFRDSDINDLADKMELIIRGDEKEKLRKIAADGQKRAVEKYDIKKCTKNVIEIYKSILKRDNFV